MQYLWFVLAGALSGILGGMGMGGGTVLIPLLSIFYKVGQHTAQAVNLISFIPMAIVALIMHLKNKFVRFDKVLFIVLPGIATCIVGCYIANAIGGELLRRFFGGFLLILSVFQFLSALKQKE
ncbi:MAG: sulfite exporter TauE/SafE family protein [Clostridia bacterium]|nr:sulfite exporter TauE/SafE family protein [Clostridia bacterium]